MSLILYNQCCRVQFPWVFPSLLHNRFFRPNLYSFARNVPIFLQHQEPDLKAIQRELGDEDGPEDVIRWVKNVIIVDKFFLNWWSALSLCQIFKLEFKYMDKRETKFLEIILHFIRDKNYWKFLKFWSRKSYTYLHTGWFY